MSKQLESLIEAAIRQALEKRDAPAPVESPFISFPELQRRLPTFGERSLREMISKGVIPSVRPPGTRKLSFHWNSVERALLRCSTGPVE